MQSPPPRRTPRLHAQARAAQRVSVPGFRPGLTRAMMGWQACEEQSGAPSQEGAAKVGERLPDSFGGVLLRQLELRRAEAVQSEMAGQLGSSGTGTFRPAGSTGPRSGNRLRNSGSAYSGSGLCAEDEHEGPGDEQDRRLQVERRNQRSAGDCTF